MFAKNTQEINGKKAVMFLLENARIKLRYIKLA